MLRKRSRSPHRDQQMGQMSDVSESYFHSDVLGQRHKTNSFINHPGLFVGCSPKSSESDSVRSPTSPLDFRVFSNLGSPFRSPRSPHEGHPKSWDCSKVGLSIVDSLGDETKQSNNALRSSGNRNILLGPQMRIKCPALQTHVGSFEAPKSLPENYMVCPCTQVGQFNPQMGSSNVLFGIGEAPTEAEPYGKIRSCSLDSRRSGSHLTSLTNLNTNSSSGKFCLGDGIDPLSSPSQCVRGNLSNLSLTKLNSIPVSIGSGNCLIGSLSASEIELSEDYTCVRTHGPNPKTTHIFGDCILECRNEFTVFPKNGEQEIPLGQLIKSTEFPVSCPSNDFLSFCYSCKKKLEGEDIFIYRGEKAFCSWTCRSQEILIEEAKEENKNGSCENSLESTSCEEHFETGIFFAK